MDYKNMWLCLVTLVLNSVVSDRLYLQLMNINIMYRGVKLRRRHLELYIFFKLNLCII
jgi:hypothetical protein